MEKTESLPRHVVGIGASAGGLQPIEEFFDNMPTDSGLSFVIVQHLSPDFKSLMDELLSRHTSMPIHKVSDGMEIEPNSIYLIPPEKNMAMSEGRLHLTDKHAHQKLHLPIDIFFSSLAKDAAERAVGIVLSGTGSDGSRGIKGIREAGGLVMVQSTETCAFDGMPRAAIGTGAVDLICPPSEMPKRIVAYVNGMDRSSLREAESIPDTADFELPSGLSKVFRLFRQRFDIDFSLYKPATITRRLDRRMQMGGYKEMDSYIEFLESSEDEVDLLFRDLLVEVTHFFRDPEAFSRIKDEVIPNLIASLDPDEEIRAWVAGCATGEEAYSIAMIISDVLSSMNREQAFKVFATDVHRTSLETASSGFYPTSSLDGLPPEFRNRYFNHNNGISQIKRSIRQNVIYAANDLTKDPPFTRIDFVSCRNVLIYLEPAVQKRVLSMFHFSLKVNGVLFLGPSETLGAVSGEFGVLDRHWRIYQKLRDIRLPDSNRISPIPVLDSVIHDDQSSFVASTPKPAKEHWLSVAYEDLLTKHVPPSLLVNEFYELMHCFGNARKLLMMPEGKPTNEVLKMLDGDLRIAVSGALHRARHERVPVVYKGVRVSFGSDDHRIFKVTVEPYLKVGTGLFLISLEEVEKAAPIEAVEEDYRPAEQSDERISQLERELSYTRETLQATVEELESSNEELQATNEELIASNEELQSTNEELHSVNEELYTVNSEHKQKIEELTELTSDMDNLLKSTEIGTIFLDEDLCIRMYTPAISAAFNVMDQDIGRPIDHIAYKLDSPNLFQDVEEVLRTQVPKEVEVRSKDGRSYLQRLQLYRSDGEVRGIVITLTETTAIKAAELAQKKMLQLAAVGQELPDFAYAVSHDLQAPLRHIKQYSKILFDAVEEGDSERILKAVGIVEAGASDLTSMIDGLLQYSRVNTLGKDLVNISLSSCVNAAIQDLALTLQADGGEVEVVSDMPTVLGDSSQLKLLFFHLIDNSIKYRGADPPRIKIRSHQLHGTDYIQVEISDNGIGIAPDDAESVFTIFKRLGFKEKVPGTGIGLALCRRIAVRHRGRIWVEQPKDGIGSVVCFTLLQTE